MPVTYLSHSAYFHMSIADRYPGREFFVNIFLDALPARDLPPIYHVTHAAAPIHPGHLIILGRTQGTTIAPYSVVLPNSYDVPPITCLPYNGDLWVNYDTLRTVYLYPLLDRAFTSNTPHNWEALLAAINKDRTIPAKYPAVWTPSIATATAKPGAVIELIHFSLNIRFYSVITELIAIDASKALCWAQLLGTSFIGFYCLVKIPIDLIDACFLNIREKWTNDIQPTFNERLQTLLAQGNSVQLPEVVTSSALLETQIPLRL